MRKQLIAPIVFAVLALAMTPEAWYFDRPVTNDHAVHYAKIWQWIHHSGPIPLDIWGWSHAWFAGYPTGYTYPFLADLLVVALHGIFSLLGAWQLPLGFSYTLAIILTHFLEGHSLYTLGRVMGYRRAGFLAGMVFMTQAGAPFVGGWFWTHYVGVWPVSFSMSLAIYGCAAFHWLTTNPGPRPAGAFGILWGFALMAHPLQLIHFAVMLPAMLVAIFWRGEPGRRTTLKWLGSGVAIAAGIASFWVLPFVFTSSYSEQVFFLPWKPLPVLLAQLATGSIYEGLSRAIQLTGLAGIVLALARGNAVMFAIAMASVVLIVTGSRTFYDTLALGSISPAFNTIQYIRFQSILRPYWCLAGVVFLFPFAASIFRRRGSLIVLALFLLASLPDGTRSLFLNQTRYSLVRNHPDYESVVSWLRDVESSDPRFFRVAVFNEPDYPFSHELPELVTRVRSPVLAVNYHPSINFRTAGRGQNAATIKMLGIRFLVSERKDPGVLRDADWQFRVQLGRYFVYENGIWDDKRVSARDLSGGSADPGLVREVSWGNHTLAAEVSAGTGGTVLFHTAYFPRWRATWTRPDGSARLVVARPLRLTSDVEVIAVPIPDQGGGRLELRFETDWPEQVALIIFCLAFAAGSLLLFKPRVSAVAR